MKPKPLDGIRVLEWAVFHNGPAAGYMLGDLGAEVIKIEHPVQGDPGRGISTMSGASMFLPGGRTVMFEGANRSKKSITLNLESEKGRQIAYKLVEKCDVFFTNFRYSVVEKLGMDYPTLSHHNPRLIYAMNSGFGPLGPAREQRSFDQIVQARSGLMWAMGDRDLAEPQMVQAAILDQTGAITLAMSILAALVARERLGIAQKVEVSLFGSSIHLQCVNVNAVLWQGRAVPRHSRNRARNPMDNFYRCADGKWLRMAEPQADRFWEEFCAVLGLSQLNDDPRLGNMEIRREHYRELVPLLDKVFATKPRDEWLKLFDEKGCRFARGPIFTIEELTQDPQALENEYIVDFDHPTMGKTRAVALPMKFSQTPAGIQSPAPQFGQHTEEVLMELCGYTWDGLAQLRDEGVI